MCSLLLKDLSFNFISTWAFVFSFTLAVYGSTHFYHYLTRFINNKHINKCSFENGKVTVWPLKEKVSKYHSVKINRRTLNCLSSINVIFVGSFFCLNMPYSLLLWSLGLV